MPYALRTYTCEGCGGPVEKRAASGAAVRCIHCAIERSVENIHQLRGRYGAFHAKWAANLAKAADRAVVESAIGMEIDSIG